MSRTIILNEDHKANFSSFDDLMRDIVRILFNMQKNQMLKISNVIIARQLWVMISSQTFIFTTFLTMSTKRWVNVYMLIKSCNQWSSHNWIKNMTSCLKKMKIQIMNQTNLSNVRCRCDDIMKWWLISLFEKDLSITWFNFMLQILCWRFVTNRSRVVFQLE